MIKSILGGKSKNLFDISKVVTSNAVKRNGNSLICSSYGASIGTLGSICPTLKPSDLITISFKCASEGVPSNFMAFDGKTFYSGATFLVSEIGLSTPWYLYSTNYEHRDIPNKTTYSDIQLELGSTATEYVPHELTSYKSIMKVSDVCQLVDKSKIPTTRTISGVTFTNNGDGSVTIDGTSTHQYYSEIVIPIDGSLFIPGHVYLNGTIAGDFAGFVALYGPVAKDYIMEPQHIYTFPSGKDFNKFRYIIRVRKGMTANNYKCTPQPFDLTKMFGAGNEPKTVAEFRAKFPNDYYPYSPSCFVTSFDERMPCKTKNLFSSSTEVGTLQGGLGGPTVTRNFEENKWYVGLASNNYYNPGMIKEYSIKGGLIYFKRDDVNSNGYGLARAIKCEPNTTYTVSLEPIYVEKYCAFNIGYFDKNGNLISTNNAAGITKTITTPNNCNWIVFVLNFYDEYTSGKGKAYFCNLQLEKGTTATDYVPYGYV